METISSVLHKGQFGISERTWALRSSDLGSNCRNLGEWQNLLEKEPQIFHLEMGIIILA